MSPIGTVGRRTVMAAAAALAAPAIARAQAYPARPVRVVNAYSPGGTADVISRILCAALTDKLGQTFAVDNKPGAAGTIAAQIVARAPADGYTLLYDATAHSVNPSLFAGKLPYDTRKDLLPIFLSLQTPNTLMRNSAFEAKTIPELIALAKSKPGGLDCASTGVGTVQHVSLELLNQRAGIKINHVPYKEMGSARNDLFAGRIPLQFSNVPGSVALRSAKEVTCMAHAGAQAGRGAAGRSGDRRDLAGLRDLGVERRVRAGRHRSRTDHQDQRRHERRLPTACDEGASRRARRARTGQHGGGVRRLPRDPDRVLHRDGEDRQHPYRVGSNAMAVDDPLLGHGRQIIVREDWLRLTEEPVLEPGLPIIDPHHHLWQRSEGSYLLPELLADTGSGHDIRGTIFVQCGEMYRAGGPEERSRWARPSSSPASPR